MQLEDFRAILQSVSAEKRAELLGLSVEAQKERVWVANPGPQRAAELCEADELFYGGQAGGGKSDLSVGLALTNHQRALILRRYKNDAISLADRSKEILGDRKYDYRASPKTTLTYQGRVVDFDGCLEESDKQRHKGNPHDLICFDEISDFLESQYTFIIAWNRSTIPGQRSRVLCTGNPPTTAEGLWVIRRWAAWLDPSHPRPAAEGELRWYTTGTDGKEIEVDGRGPHLIDGQEVIAKSRTFMRARLSDNPDLAATNYDAVLAALPAEYRAAYREGRFDAALKDDAFQVIPTEWIRMAQARWTERPPEHIPQCAIGVDVAQGGQDQTILSARHDGWYAPLIKIPGKQTPDGSSVAGLVVQHRRDSSAIVVDMGGGYGGSAYERLRENVDSSLVQAYKGAEESVRRTRDNLLGFSNKRSQAYWQFREALDPGQDGGSSIMLPNDPEMVADLTAPKFKIVGTKIVITSKEQLVKDLGRSTDAGDAVVMAWTGGPKAVTHAAEWLEQGRARKRTPRVDFGTRHNRLTPRVNMGPRRH